jgi:hypothetical protein
MHFSNIWRNHKAKNAKLCTEILPLCLGSTFCVQEDTNPMKIILENFISDYILKSSIFLFFLSGIQTEILTEDKKST